MSQSNVIAGAIALAFLLFITLRGELPKYLGLFVPQKRVAASSNGSGGGSGSDMGKAASTAIDAAKIAAMFI